MSSSPRIPGVPRALRPFAALSAVLLLSACPGTDPVTPEPNPQPTNNAPAAAAGADQTASATLPVMLDGSASTDSDGDPITYSWSFSGAPSGSAAAFDDATSATPSFTPDLPGAYTVQLVVNDGTVDSPADQLTVTAEDNTTSTTIDASGGQAVSKDGGLTLDIPAGALGTSEDIVITAVPASQLPTELAGLGPNDVVYDMKPDGLQFAQPVTVTMTAPTVWEPTASGDSVSAPLAAMLTLSGGTFELAGSQESAIDIAAGTTEIQGTIDHFSLLAVTVDNWTEGFLRFYASTAKTWPLDTPVPVAMGLWGGATGNVGSRLTNLTMGPPVTIQQNPSTSLNLDSNQGVWWTSNSYTCSVPGANHVQVKVELWGVRVLVDGSIVPEGNPISRTVKLDFTCVDNRPFGPFTALFAESAANVGPSASGPLLLDQPGNELAASMRAVATPGPFVVAHWAGARLAGPIGEALADFTAPELNFAQVFGAAGNMDDGVVTYSGHGLFGYAGALPSSESMPTPQHTLTLMAQPGTGPDMSAHATDAYHFGAPGSRGMAAVLYGDQDIAFFNSGTDTGGGAGFVFDNSVATSFKPGGVSIFGGVDIPVSVYVQPSGFTDNDPILVITEANDATLETKLWLVERNGSSVTATHVDTLFPYDAGRRVRCLDGICAITANGTAVGFGATTMFSWDGGSGFSHVQTLVGRTIGVDLSHTTGGDIQIATTSFTGNTFAVHLISAGGVYLNTAFAPVPQGCLGPGHIAFRQESEVIVTCNTTGNVVSETFTYPAPN